MIVRELYIISVIVGVVLTKSLRLNETTVLTPTYSKVASFGKPTGSEGRSSGQSLYTQSSDAKIRRGQNLNTKVFYNSKHSRVGEDKYEVLPAKGEVIQERFNPKPYFDYIHEPPHKIESSPKETPKPSPVYGTPFDSFPVFKSPDNSKVVTVDAKPSNFDSIPPIFNPTPNTQPDFDSISPVYKPPQDTKPNFDSIPPVYSPTPDTKPVDFESIPPVYNPPPNSKPAPSKNSYDSPYDSYHPPPTQSSKEPNPVYPPLQSYDSPPKPDSAHPTYNSYNKPNKPEMEMSDNKNNNNNFVGPYAPHELDSPPKDYDTYGGPPPTSQDTPDVGPAIAQTAEPPSHVDTSYQEYPPSYHNHDHGHASIDDSVPPEQPPPPSSFGKIPEYLDHEPKGHGYSYADDHYFDHHPIYHEITTTEAPEERVNKAHYSYYYLGRKLWYIPLYFSIYFIIYITVLILKSIARHKVTFWHDLQDLHDKGRSARNLELDNLTTNVTNAIDYASNKYMM